MKLKIVGGKQEPGLFSPGIANGREGIAHGASLSVCYLQCFPEGQASHGDQGAQHIRLKADALFVRKRRGHKRAGRNHASLPKGPENRQAGQDAVAAVIRSGMDHSVNMGPYHQGIREPSVRTRENAEKVADPVHPDIEPCLFHPSDHQIPARFFAFREGEPRSAAARIQPHCRQTFNLPQKHIAPQNRTEIGISS